MKKRRSKKSVKHTPSSSMMEAATYEPKPFSAHFHVEGRTMDELHSNVTDLLKKHAKAEKHVRQYKGKKRHDRTTVEKALSS